MKSRRWYLLSLFVIVCLFSFLANGMESAPPSVMAQTLPPPPALNDNFADAALIDTLPFTVRSDIASATIEPDEPLNCAMMSKSIWYRYVPAVDTILQIDMNGSTFYDTALSVWQGTVMNGLQAVTCASWWDGSLEFTAVAGQTYYIQTGRYYDEAWGELQLNVVQILPPPNDTFANANQIQALPLLDSLSTRWATTEAGEPVPSCAWSFGGRTVWYAFTPAVNSSLFTYIDANFSSVLAVYTGSSLDSLHELGCRVWQDRLTFSAQAGTTYYVQVGSLYDYGGQVSFHLDATGAPEAQFSYDPYEPSVFDTVYFHDNSYDPYGGVIQSRAWNFGDGATATDYYSTHRYAADGNYAVTLAVTTADGRTATTTQNIAIKTHDIAVTKFTVPTSAGAGQTRSIVVGINSRRYDETVQVRLFKSNPGDSWSPWLEAGTLPQFVPVRPSNRTTDFNFSYTFTPDDAKIGKVSFKAVAVIVTGRDALPADNEAIAPPTKVSSKGRTLDSSEIEGTTQDVQIFLPVVVNE